MKRPGRPPSGGWDPRPLPPPGAGSPAGRRVRDDHLTAPATSRRRPGRATIAWRRWGSGVATGSPGSMTGRRRRVVPRVFGRSATWPWRVTVCPQGGSDGGSATRLARARPSPSPARVRSGGATGRLRLRPTTRPRAGTSRLTAAPAPRGRWSRRAGRWRARRWRPRSRRGSSPPSRRPAPCGDRRAGSRAAVCRWPGRRTGRGGPGVGRGVILDFDPAAPVDGDAFADEALLADPDPGLVPEKCPGAAEGVGSDRGGRVNPGAPGQHRRPLFAIAP